MPHLSVPGLFSANFFRTHRHRWPLLVLLASIGLTAAAEPGAAEPDVTGLTAAAAADVDTDADAAPLACADPLAWR